MRNPHPAVPQELYPLYPCLLPAGLEELSSVNENPTASRIKISFASGRKKQLKTYIYLYELNPPFIQCYPEL